MILKTILFAILVTFSLSFVKNQSNIPSNIVIPILVALLAKYTLGDWDKGYVFTTTDIFYWITILLTSYLTLNILE